MERPLRAAIAIGLVAMFAGWSSPVHAEERSVIDFDAVALYFGPIGNRTEIFIFGYTWGYRFKSLYPYVGGGFGFFAMQARGGVTWMPGNLEEPTPIVRLEALPQLIFNPCIESLVVGSLGVGYRFPLEHNDPNGIPGTALFVLPAFTGGDGILHGQCGKADEVPLRSSLVIGGSLTGGFDF